MAEINTITDVELIESCLNGNEDSFEELVNRYKNLVYSIILKQTKNSDEASDIAQDVFLKAYKNLKSYTSQFKFSTWIMRITSNHIIDLHRKRKLDTVSYEAYTEESGVGIAGVTPSPESDFLKEEETRRINKIVSSLPDMYKIPVLLYHQEDLSYQEISEKIGEPISKVKNRIFRGRKLLKGLMTE